MINAGRGLFGFTSMGDFFTTLFGLNTIVANTLVGIFTSLIAFVAHSSAQNIFVMKIIYGLILVDWVLGVVNAMRRGDFTSFKIMRAFLMLFLLSVILYFSWSLAMISVVFSPVAPFIVGGIVVSYFVSLLEHVIELDILPPSTNKILKELKDYLSVDRFIKRFRDKYRKDEDIESLN